jgi:hypothetical protein
MPKDNKTDGTILLELLAARDISSREFKRIYKAKAACAENTANHLLQKDTTVINPPTLHLICSLFGFSPTDFGYAANAFESEHSISNDREVYSYNYRDEGNLAYRPYMENFFRTVNKHLLLTKNTLRISDYIGKFAGIRQNEHIDYYTREATAYFHKIETRLAATQFTYSRIFQLPLGSKIDDARSAKQYVVETLLPSTFAHLCRCLYHHENQCAFYIVPRPFRMYSYYLIDESTIITEYNRFDKDGVPVPDLLFVNMALAGNDNGVGNVYIKSAVDEFDRMVNQNKQYGLNAYSFCTAVFELKSKREESKKSLVQEISLVKQQLEPLHPGLTEYFEKTRLIEDLLLQLNRLEGQIQLLDEKLRIWSDIAAVPPLGVRTVKAHI